jgi:hypothetical protein
MYLLLYVQSWTPDDEWKDHLKNVEYYSKINKFEKLVHIVGFIIEVYYDAQTYERQSNLKFNLCGSNMFVCKVWVTVAG